MSFLKHSDLRIADPGARIWRFLDMAKFLDLIHSGELNLRRGDLFEDPYEGLMFDDQVWAIADPARRHERIVSHAHRRADYYVTCWHLSEDEPAGMWKLYGGADGGIAITSTYGRLHRELDSWLYEPSYLGVVEYGDWSWDIDRPSNDILALMHKRRNFSHEREVRGLIRCNGAGGIARNIDRDGTIHAMPIVAPVSRENFRLKIDVDALITSVVLSPACPEWWMPLLREMVHRLGYTIPVSRSDLYEVRYLARLAGEAPGSLASLPTVGTVTLAPYDGKPSTSSSAD
jgi:hypothetical protein